MLDLKLCTLRYIIVTQTYLDGKNSVKSHIIINKLCVSFIKMLILHNQIKTHNYALQFTSRAYQPDRMVREKLYNKTTAQLLFLWLNYDSSVCMGYLNYVIGKLTKFKNNHHATLLTSTYKSKHIINFVG